MRDRIAAAALIVLLALAVVGKSAVMAASVAGMAAAWWATRADPFGRRLAATAGAAVGAALVAEAVHTIYHRVVPYETGDDLGGFWFGALAVGAINAAAFGVVLLAAAWAGRRQGAASRSSAS